MTTTSSKVSLCGCSFCGKLHRRMRQKNQDALKLKQYSFGCILAVADGVGSQKYSRYGSRAVVLAVHQAFLEYVKGDIKRRQITQRITEMYRCNLPFKFADQASTTCIFAAHIYNEGLYLGQIGDGMCCFSINESFGILSNIEAEFTNIVRALNTRNNAQWHTKFFSKEVCQKLHVVLSTDGISEDILPDREENFMQMIIKQTAFKSSAVANLHLRQLQENVFPAYAVDDKTIAAYSFAKIISR